MAKTFSVQGAVDEAGNVNATQLATQLRRGKPLSDDLRTIGQFGDQFRSVARVPDAGAAGEFTIFDVGLGGGMALTTGNPLPLALAAARPTTRHAILSRPVQNAMANKSYSDPLVEALLARPGANAAIRNLPAAGAMTAN